MMSLLLVDDERHVTEWLEELFEKTNLFRVEKAHSGAEALCAIERHPVDILLSDIKMPGMSGFDLAEQVFARWPACHVVFLSGHATFDFVYRANRHNVKYLLKTEDDDVIMEAVLREKRMIEAERAAPPSPHAPIPDPVGADLGAALLGGDERRIAEAFDALIGAYQGRRMDAAEPLAAYQSALSMVVAQMGHAAVAADLKKLMQPGLCGTWAEAFTRLEATVRRCLSGAFISRDEDKRQLAARVERYIQEHVAEDLSLARIAHSVAYNPSYISRVYRQATGENITDCVKRTRIDAARALLSRTEDAVQDVALSCGFESAQYFATVFRQLTGFAPLEYRKAFYRAPGG